MATAATLEYNMRFIVNLPECKAAIWPVGRASLGENLPQGPVHGKGKSAAATLPREGVIAALSRAIDPAYARIARRYGLIRRAVDRA